MREKNQTNWGTSYKITGLYSSKLSMLKTLIIKTKELNYVKENWRDTATEGHAWCEISFAIKILLGQVAISDLSL